MARNDRWKKMMGKKLQNSDGYDKPDIMSADQMAPVGSTAPPPLEKQEPQIAPDDEVSNDPSDRKAGSLQQSFKCKSCGAKMEFKPGSGSQVCPYCDHENPIPESEKDIKELDFKAYMADMQDSSDMQETLVIKCPECAAETTSLPNITSQECPYCGVNIVATASSKKLIKPKSLLPFKVTKKESWDSFKKWATSLWFAPNDLKKLAGQAENVSGVYVPYWTYDTDTTTFYRGQRGEHYWVTEHYTTTVNGKSVRRSRQVRKTRWYPAWGTVWNIFDDVLVLASKSLPRKYTEALEPWDLENLVPYKDEYLSGMKSESYQVDLIDGFGNAQRIMDEELRHLVKRDIGGDVQRITSMNTQYDDITFKHILLPVWISAYRYKEKVFRFLVNARTGEVQGERPYSWVKIALAVIAGAAILGTIALIALQNQ